MRILGIDPGSLTTGFGIIQLKANEQFYIASGCIRTGNKPWQERMLRIYYDLTTVINEYKPEIVAIEQVFVHKNVSSALKLGHARGVAILAVAKQNLSIAEYAPRKIKLAVVGNGGAEKSQVQHMVQVLLRLDNLPQADAADALAVAICHGNHLTEKIIIGL